MAKTKQIKTQVYPEDYKKLSAIASLHGRKIWEELSFAIRDYNARFKFTEISTATTVAVAEKTETELTPTDEYLITCVKKCADTLNLSEDDTSFKAFCDCRMLVAQVLDTDLEHLSISKDLFDKAQEERRKDLCKSKSPSQKKTIID